MEERGNKTIICSVFFLDIVEYSKKSVSGQISQKERFNAFLSTAIRDVPIEDRIILDTGDGAAISFIGDVEDALRAALSMRSSLFSEEGLAEPSLLVRMGVNLGPVRLVRDINGQPNIVGDGINVAQRIMGFADPGQILVSRSYYDAASRLSQEYAGMFHYEGMRTDKHVREHEVYAIGYPGDFTSTQKRMLPKPGSELASESNGLAAKCKTYWDAFLARCGGLFGSVRAIFSHASGKQKALYSGLIAIMLSLSAMVAIKLVSKPEESISEQTRTAEGSAVVAQSALSPAASASVAVSNPAKPPIPKHEAKPEAHQKQEKGAPEKSKQETAKQKSDKAKQEAAKQKTEKTKQEAGKQKPEKAKQEAGKQKPDAKQEKGKQGGKPKAAEPGVITLAVRPWGEVYLDGKMVDVSPPLTRLEVPAGVHVIELKNANFPVYKQSIKIKAGENLSISYKFTN